MTIREILSVDERLDELAALLIDAVDSRASVGFLAPLALAEAVEYWRGVTGCVLLVAEDAQGRIVGSVQVDPCLRANGSHRAEIKKLLVHRDVRRQGLGRALMRAAEESAQSRGQTLLVLDTRCGDPSEALYLALGYQRAGVIPRYARSSGSDGSLHDTVILYKELS